MSNFAVTNLSQRALPNLPFAEYKEKILGRGYDLSLVFCGSTLTRRLNKTYRRKDKVANILSFPLSKSTGEIFINRASHDFSFPHLFIHGLLHLKGWTHSSKMEAEERKFLTLFAIIDGQSQSHRRTRHRNRLGPTRCL